MCLKCSLFGMQSECETEIGHYSTRFLEIPCTVISLYFENEEWFPQIFIEVKSRGKKKYVCVDVLQEPQSYIQAHGAFTGGLYGKIIAFRCLG